MTPTRPAVLALGLSLLAFAAPVSHGKAGSGAAASPTVLNFTVRDIDGRSVPLSRYKGDVLLIVNTASLCGNTPQYASLETLYRKYKSQGLRILAFPADDFAHQEPGTNGQIRQFCTSKYHASFDLFSKISVKQPHQAPLYAFLTDKRTDPKFGGDIEWNFAKFLTDRRGRVIARVPAGHDPLSPDVVAQIEAALKQPVP